MAWTLEPSDLSVPELCAIITEFGPGPEQVEDGPDEVGPGDIDGEIVVNREGVTFEGKLAEVDQQFLTALADVVRKQDHCSFSFKLVGWNDAGNRFYVQRCEPASM